MTLEDIGEKAEMRARNNDLNTSNALTRGLT